MMRLISPAVFLLCVFLSSCSEYYSFKTDFFTMDTVCSVNLLADQKKDAQKGVRDIELICGELEAMLSKTVETSDISRLNRNGTGTKLSDTTVKILKKLNELKKLTDGAYDAAVGDFSDLWGINGSEPGEMKTLPEKEKFYPLLDIDRTVTFDGETINFSGNLNFDLGGAAKGYALDAISKNLSATGVVGGIISFGSSIYAKGKNKDGKLWVVGIKNPLDPEKVDYYIEAEDKFISVSAGYQRYIEINGKKYCHIINPETGYPVDNDLLCVVVVTDAGKKSNESLNGLTSDVLSTALFVMGKEKALEFYSKGLIDFEMVLFAKDESAPDGINIISTNLIFNEINSSETK